MIKLLKKILVAKFPATAKKYSFFYNCYLIRNIWLLRNKPKGVLVYVGVNVGESLAKIFYKFERVIGYEPNPLNFSKLQSKFGHFNNIEIYNFAAADKDGYHDFFLSDNNNHDASSSLLNFSNSRTIKAKQVIQVRTILLSNHLKIIGVDFIDEYISDTEGYDFSILKTLSEFIENNKIHFITCEVLRNGKPDPFLGSMNYESNFDEFLPAKFRKIGSGWGILCDDHQYTIPDSYNFMDVRWQNTEYRHD